MKVLDIKRTQIFDGMDDELRLFVHRPESSEEKVEIPLCQIVSFTKLAKSADRDILEKIANKIGTKIRSFDGNLIFQGCEKGLRLYGFKHLGEKEDSLYVYSMGEIQPARFICFYEGAFKLKKTQLSIDAT